MFYFALLLLMLIASIQHLQEVPWFSSANSDQNSQKIEKNTYSDRTILNMHKLPGWTPFASNLGGELAAVFGVVAL